ncbi:MAG TPA: helix-turn-helix domain-containing protein [Paraburkholderia sp.]|nr:helix-turn-helix domain-containing protein [Paraburkholderia sp.]
MNTDPTVLSSWVNVFRAPAEEAGWDAILSDIMQPGHLKIDPRARFDGAATTARLSGGGVIADLRMPAMEVVHQTEHVIHSTEREVLVHLVLEGSGTLEQENTRFRFQVGDITFRSAHQPSKVQFCGTSVHLIALRLPLSRWQGYLPATLRGPALAPHDHSLTQTVNAFVHQMENGSPDCNRTALAALEQSFVLLLGAACQQFHPHLSADNAQSEGVRWRQIHDYIDTHLFDAELTPKDCAEALQISERYLYRVLAGHGERFSQIQLRKRLDASAERLRDPRFSRYQIASIAYQCGFKDAAHFSRVFSKRFGVTPRAWRAYDGMSI